MLRRRLRSTDSRAATLRAALAQHYQRKEYEACESMGALVQENLKSLRLRLDRQVVLPEILPES